MAAPKKKQPKPAPAALRSAYAKGASIRALARKTGVSYGTVHNRLADAGTKMRSRGGPNHRK